MGRALACLLVLFACASEPEEEGPPPCGSLERGLRTVVPGPGTAGFDADLEAKARRHDRMFVAIHSRATGLNQDFVPNADVDRGLFEAFAAAEGTDFEAVTGHAPETLGTWHKVAGLYAGVGAAADAYRYGALRDAGEACDEVDAARAQLIRAMEGMDVASRINGVPGVTARGLLRTDLPHAGDRAPTPLFDEQGTRCHRRRTTGSGGSIRPATIRTTSGRTPAAATCWSAGRPPTVRSGRW